jgi:hypothetical protein
MFRGFIGIGGSNCPAKCSTFFPTQYNLSKTVTEGFERHGIMYFQQR